MGDPMDECRDPKTDCPWNEDHSERWVEAVDEAPWKSNGLESWVKVLDCPRCGHEMSVDADGGWEILSLEEDVDLSFVTGHAEAEPEAKVAEKPSEPSKVPAQCNCAQKHPNQPAGPRAGCGQRGVIAAPVT